MRTLIALTVIIMGTFAFSMEGESSIGPANPAAVNCIKLEGKLETVVTPAGQDANCVVEEWHLYREMYKRGLVKEHHYPVNSIGMPNPAAVNCIDIGGSLRTETTPGGEYGLCVIPQWTLFRVIDVTREGNN